VCFARFQPPLMSNVGRYMPSTHKDDAASWEATYKDLDALLSMHLVNHHGEK
jgi:hypothetical protein